MTRRPFLDLVSRRLLVVLLAVSTGSMADADEPRLLADLNTLSAGSQPSDFTAAGAFTVFEAATDPHGRELWVSDGTTEGTRLWIDLRPGPESSETPGFSRTLTAVGERFLFSGTTDGSAPSLWTTDRPVVHPDFVEDPRPVVLLDAFDGIVAPWGEDRAVVRRFPADGSTEFWVTDGTGDGTRLLGTLGVDGWPNSLEGFFVLGDLLVTGGITAEAGREPWTVDLVDGTATSLGDFHPGQGYGADIRRGTAWNGRVYYPGSDSITGSEMWSTDGTAQGTGRVADLHPGGSSSYPGFFRGAGPRLFFTAYDPARDRFGLWVYDGGAPSVLQPSESFIPILDGAVELNDRLLFAAWTDEAENQLWISDGTVEGTRRLSDQDGGAFPQDAAVLERTDGPDLALVRLDSREVGRELWVTDGTDLRLLADIRPGRFGSEAEPTVVNGQFWFHAQDGLHGDEPWISDGSSARLLADLRQEGTDGTSPVDLVSVGDRAYLGLSSNDRAPLWTTDGTETGTVPVRGAETLDYVRSLTGPIADDRVYFESRDDAHGQGIFRVQGEGPAVALDLEPGPAWTRVDDLARGGDRLFFTRWIDDDLQLWRLDDEDRGVFVADLLSDALDPPETFLDGSQPATKGPYFLVDPRQLFSWGSGVGAFIVDENGDFDITLDEPEQLWFSDGTPEGTRVVAETHHVAVFGERVVTADGRLFFEAEDEIHGRSLWVSDGTAQGTRPIPGTGSVQRIVARGSGVYFTAFVSGAMGLWRSDGTAEGTALAFPDPVGDRLQTIGDFLYFLADVPGSGFDLWRLEGPEDFAEPVADLEQNAFPLFLESDGRSLFFSAETSEFGRELYQANSETGQVRRIGDVAPGSAGSDPSSVVRFGHQLLWFADDRFHGREPWILGLNDALPCVPGDRVLCLGNGRFEVRVGWRDFQDQTGFGQSKPITADTGSFWFFDAANLELVIKVLDGRDINGHYWVFVGSLSSVEFDLQVRDLQTGQSVVYHNPLGTQASIGDTLALPDPSPRQEENR